MKKHSQWERIKFALTGLKLAWRQEASFRTEAGVFIGVIAYLIWRQPPFFWWLEILLAAALVLIAELLNTALENVCDALRPEQDAKIGAAKDCASAAVLVANTMALGLLAVFLWKTR